LLPQSEYEDLLIIGRLLEARLRLRIVSQPLRLARENESLIQEAISLAELIESEERARQQCPQVAEQPA
jgi:hypothetical protein